MANSMYLSALKKNRQWVLSIFRFLRIRPDLSGVDFRGMGLRSVDLSKANLTGANFSGESLSGANFKEATLTKASFNGAILTGVIFVGANITRADLVGAILAKADLTNANLTGADLSEANLTEANLTNANLTEAKLGLARLYRANLSRSNLSRTELLEADLLKVDLSEANLVETRLGGARLSHTNLYKATVCKADLRLVRLYKARLDEASLDEVWLWETQRAKWSIKGVKCESVFWDQDGESKTTYKPGEFELLHSNKTKVRVFYEGGLCAMEILTLPELIQVLERSQPGCKLRFVSIQEEAGGAVVELEIENAGDLQPDKIKRPLEAIAKRYTEGRRTDPDSQKQWNEIIQLLQGLTKQPIYWGNQFHFN